MIWLNWYIYIYIYIFKCIHVMYYVMNMCPKVCETLWLISMIRDCGISLSKTHHIFYLFYVCFLENLDGDCIGNMLYNMYIFFYCYYGWIRQFLKLFSNVASPIFQLQIESFSRVLGYLIFGPVFFGNLSLGHCFWQCNFKAM